MLTLMLGYRSLEKIASRILHTTRILLHLYLIPDRESNHAVNTPVDDPNQLGIFPATVSRLSDQ